MDQNKYYFLLGRDRNDVERKEQSDETYRLFAEEFHMRNNTGFLLKIRELFLNIKCGSNYSAYGSDDLPRTFFYCPLHVTSDLASDIAAAVWGECGIYSTGREFRYAQYYLENYASLDAHTLLCKLFTSKYFTENEITDILSRGNGESYPVNKERVLTYDPDYSKEISDKYRYIVAAVAEKLCDGKTVIIRLADSGDFNRDSKDLIAQIMSMLPGDFRRQVGFVTYLQADQIKRFRDQSNNIRLIVVDSDVETTEFENSDPFAVFNFDKDYIGDVEYNEDFAEWSRIDFADREQQIGQFSKIRSGKLRYTREILPEMINVYREAQEFAAEFPTQEVRACSTPEALAEYFNQFEICRIVPLARQEFARQIPRMLPEGTSLEEMLLEALRCGDERRRKAARFCLFNFVKDQSKLIGPIERCIERADDAGVSRQREEDSARFAALDSKVSELESNISTLRESNDARGEKITSLESELDVLSKSNDERGKRVTELESDINTLRESNDARGEKITSLESERNELSKQAETQKLKINNLETELDSKKKDWDDINIKLGEVNRQLQDTEGKLSDSELRYSEECEKSNAMSLKIKSMEDEIRDKSEKISTLAEKSAQLSSELESSRSEADELKAANRGLSDKLAAAEKSLEDTKKALLSAEDENRRLSEDVAAKNVILKQNSEKIDELTGRLEKFQHDMVDLQAEITTLNEQKNDYIKQLSIEKSAAESARNDCALAKQESARLASENQNARNEIEANRIQISKLYEDVKNTINMKSRELSLGTIISERLDVKLVLGAASVIALLAGTAVGIALF